MQTYKKHVNFGEPTIKNKEKLRQTTNLETKKGIHSPMKNE
jgi:hypothetical protein